MDDMLLRRIKFGLLIGIAFFYLFVLQMSAMWPYTIDDMYIPLRYAKHWSMGYGLLWNIGELPVEGYSNFLFVVLARYVYVIGVDPILVLKGAGVLGSMGTCIALYGLGRFWFKPNLALLPCVWLLSYYGQIVWSVSGLETTVFQALLCFCVVFIFKGLGYLFFPKKREPPRKGYLLVAGLMLTLMGMLRPEAPFLMALFTILIFWDIASLGQRYHLLFAFLSPLFLVFLPYFLWRWHYFGYLFPNTVYCKALVYQGIFRLDKRYLHLIWPSVLLIGAAIWCYKKDPHQRALDKRFYFLCLPSILYLALMVTAHPVSAMFNRLFLPVWPLILPITLLGLYLLLMGGGRLSSYFALLELQQKKTQSLIAVYAGVLFFSVFFIPIKSLSAYSYATIDMNNGALLRQKVTDWLKRHTHEKSRIVLGDCGQIPYWVKANFIDAYCLNNKEMTQQSNKHMYQHWCENILKTNPDVVILYDSIREPGEPAYAFVDTCLAKELRKYPEYKETAIVMHGLDMTGAYRIFSKKAKENNDTVL